MTTQRADLRDLVEQMATRATQLHMCSSHPHLTCAGCELGDWVVRFTTALSAPGEPVAWMYRSKLNGVLYFSAGRMDRNEGWYETPLYLSPHAHAEGGEYERAFKRLVEHLAPTGQDLAGLDPEHLADLLIRTDEAMLTPAPVKVATECPDCEGRGW